jgi:hypothetical protein
MVGHNDRGPSRDFILTRRRKTGDKWASFFAERIPAIECGLIGGLSSGHKVRGSDLAVDGIAEG